MKDPRHILILIVHHCTSHFQNILVARIVVYTNISITNSIEPTIDTASHRSSFSWKGRLLEGGRKVKSSRIFECHYGVNDNGF